MRSFFASATLDDRLAQIAQGHLLRDQFVCPRTDCRLTVRKNLSGSEIPEFPGELGLERDSPNIREHNRKINRKII